MSLMTGRGTERLQDEGVGGGEWLSRIDQRRPVLGLTAGQIGQYRRDGFLGPLRFAPPSDVERHAATVRQALTRPGTAPCPSIEDQRGRLAEDLRDGVASVPFIECRHLDDQGVASICTVRPVAEAVAAVLGPKLSLWRSTVISKEPGAGEFAWHQDWGGVHTRGTEYGLEPPLHTSAWMALTEATVSSGCLQFARGVRAVLGGSVDPSHKNATPLAPEPPENVELVDMELAPGEFVLFSDRALHRSHLNVTDSARLALVVRYTAHFVAVRPHFPGHYSVPVEMALADDVESS